MEDEQLEEEYLEINELETLVKNLVAETIILEPCIGFWLGEEDEDSIYK